MKNPGLLFAAILLMTLLSCKSSEKKVTDDNEILKNWEMVWADEFNYTGLPDTNAWAYDVGGHGWGNQEKQYYTELRRENARVENGMLIIEARKEPVDTNDYSSARLVTRGKNGFMDDLR
jgi:beta-glucanase (GH16 family)